MSKIISITEKYATREGKNCFILICIDDFNETKENGGFNAIMTDKAVMFEDITIQPEIEGDEPTIENVLKVVEVINRKAVFYSYTTIDALFTEIGDPIDPSKSFSAQLDSLHQKALLFLTQKDPLYNTIAADWKIF
jgi:hypothetical protein